MLSQGNCGLGDRGEVHEARKAHRETSTTFVEMTAHRRSVKECDECDYCLHGRPCPQGK